MNKKLSIIMIGIFVFLTLAVFAQAATITSGLTSGKVVLDVDYGNLKKDDKDNTTLDLSALSLILANKGNTSETVALSLNSVTTGYTLKLSNSSLTIGNGTSQTVTLNANVPINVDSYNPEDEKLNSIGKLKVGSTEYTIQTKVKSKLELDEIKVYVDSKKEDTLDSTGDKIQDIRPGSKIELKFDVRNKFDDDYKDGDIKDIELNVKFKDNDDEDDFDEDLDEDADEFDLDAGEKDNSISIKFTVPGKADEKTYDLVVSLEGKDDNGAKHYVTWDIELDVDRKKDDVQLEKVSLTNSNFKCVRSSTLRTTLTNYGSNSHKDAALSIYSKGLNLNYNFQDITLDEDPTEDDNSYSKVIPFIVGDTQKAGTYYLEVRGYIDNNKRVAYKSMTVKVEDCPTTTTKNKSSDVIVVSGTPSTGTGTTTTTTTGTTGTGTTTSTTAKPTASTTETSFTQIKGIVIFMGIVTFLLLVVIVLMIYVLLKK